MRAFAQEMMRGLHVFDLLLVYEQTAFVRMRGKMKLV